MENLSKIKIHVFEYGSRKVAEKYGSAVEKKDKFKFFLNMTLSGLVI